MSDLIGVTFKSIGQIFMFDYFHRENSYSMISKINMVTFFVLIIYKALTHKVLSEGIIRSLTLKNLTPLLTLVALTFINQTCYVYNLVTYSFIVCDLGDQVYAMFSYYMRLSTGEEKGKRYRNGYLTFLQLLLVIVIFTMDVEFENLVICACIVIIEIVSKSFRFKVLKQNQLEQVQLDFLSIVLSLGLHIIISLYNIVFSVADNQQQNSEEQEEEDFFHYKNLIQFIGFIFILVIFSLANNEGLKAKKTKNFRHQLQCVILWVLLIFNKYLDPIDMHWSSWTMIFLYGCLGLLEMYNLKEDESEGLLISSNTQHMHREESYAEISMKNFIMHIKRNKDSKKLLILLGMNFSFMFVELIYGIISNSLSLIGDSAHMLFDASALAIGLYASFMSKLQPSLLFSYGYERFQVLSGFVNGLFLLFVAFNIFVESIERIYSPQVVYSEKMMVVSILGLLINFIGLCFFSEHAHQGCVDHDHGDASHSHSHDKKDHDDHHHDHEHDHDHSHDHHKHHDHHHDEIDDEDSHMQTDHSHKNKGNSCDHKHDHSHGEHKHEHSHNENLSGVFLHILADTLGSVGVIISSILIQWYEWYISDPIMSFIISVLIFVSVFPLVRSSMVILLQSYQPQHEKMLNDIVQKIKNLNEVVSYSNLRFYSYTSTAAVFSINVLIKSNVNQQYALEKIQQIILKSGKIKYYTIEISHVKQINGNQQNQQQYIQETAQIVTEEENNLFIDSSDQQINENNNCDNSEEQSLFSQEVISNQNSLSKKKQLEDESEQILQNTENSAQNFEDAI